MGRCRTSKFQNTYGIHRNDFAETENVSPEAITMRLKKFNTPYQRREKPTKYEIMYGRTLYEIAEERGLHPSTIIAHEKKYGNAYYHNPYHFNTKEPDPDELPRWREAVQNREYWNNNQTPWLHPEHPDYEQWRSGKLFPERYKGGSNMTAEQVETMMAKRGWSKYKEVKK